VGTLLTVFNRTRKRVIAAIAAAVLLPVAAWWALYQLDLAPPPGQKMIPPFNLSDRLDRLELEEREGKVTVVFRKEENKETVYDSEEFLREVMRRQQDKSSWGGLFSVLDITSWTGVFWVTFGLIGQCLFAARMLVQWLASEKAKASVIPVQFWWLSLIGSTMIVIYFIWRVELVGILGQATGWFVYVRNLWFIHTADEASNSEKAEKPA
jgi:lipid-A-disaccharide synthase-like uncharacterized protein